MTMMTMMTVFSSCIPHTPHGGAVGGIQEISLGTLEKDRHHRHQTLNLFLSNDLGDDGPRRRDRHQPSSSSSSGLEAEDAGCRGSPPVRLQRPGLARRGGGDTAPDPAPGLLRPRPSEARETEAVEMGRGRIRRVWLASDLRQPLGGVGGGDEDDTGLWVVPKVTELRREILGDLVALLAVV